MNKTTSILLLTLLGSTLVAAELTTMRYESAGELQLTMEQDIYPSGRAEPLAGRRFEMAFTIDGKAGDGQLLTELTDISGSYEAHGMNQRLSVNHLKGQQVMLGNDGLVISLDDPGHGVSMGAITDGELHPSAILVDVLPTLPDAPAHPGLSWETVQPVSSLEGWAWAGGEMRYRHEVVAISEMDSDTVVKVQTFGEATVTAASGTEGYLGEGTLERRIEWSFKTGSGKLVSLTMEQEGQGVNSLPQGQVEVRQVTRIDLKGS